MSVAAIKITQKDLKLSDSEYRKLLLDVAGVHSATALDEDGQKAVLQAMYKIKYQRKQALKTRHKSPAESKIWQLWFELKDYLEPQQRNAGYFAGFVSHIGPVRLVGKTLYFDKLSKSELHKTIEALKHRINYEKEQLKQSVPF